MDVMTFVCCRWSLSLGCVDCFFKHDVGVASGVLWELIDGRLWRFVTLCGVCVDNSNKGRHHDPTSESSDGSMIHI
jgi:hypothetical protein